MSNTIIRSLTASVITSAIATIIASFTLNNINSGELTILAVLFFMASIITALVVTNNKTKSTSQTDQPTPVRINKSRETGVVKWFNTNKGFGFITRDNGDDVFVHFRSIRGQGHRTLIEGQRVEFNISKGEKGLQAEDVDAAS
jgi:cold shock protein